MENNNEKKLIDILNLEGEPNILDEMISTDFKEFKIRMHKKKADPDAISLEGYDDAIIGLSNKGALVYDIDKMRKLTMEAHEMDSTEADEHLLSLCNNDFSVLSPIFISINFDLLKISL